MTDLDKLIAAVEAGEWLAVLNTAGKVFPKETADIDRRNCYYWVLDAYRNQHGLDAAHRLHEALLPGWVARPQIGGGGAGVTVWHCTLEDWDSGAEIDANNMPGPARAWLLAILRAIKAKGGS